MNTRDYHLHTKFSSDSTEDMERSVEAAIKVGLSGIAFTEHLDLDFPEINKKYMLEEYGDSIYIHHPDFDERPLFTFDIPAYLEKIKEMQNKYGDRIEILTGFEAGMRPGRPDLAKEYADIKKEHDFKMVLGSMHLLSGEDPYFESLWEGKTADYVVAKYFDELAECVHENDFFDSLAHMDYIVRYLPERMLPAPRPVYFNQVYDKNQSSIDFILRTLIKRGQALEINTKGMAKGLEHAHPAEPVLARYKELGGSLLTYGSDSHTADFVGKGIIW